MSYDQENDFWQNNRRVYFEVGGFKRTFEGMALEVLRGRGKLGEEMMAWTKVVTLESRAQEQEKYI